MVFTPSKESNHIAMIRGMREEYQTVFDEREEILYDRENWRYYGLLLTKIKNSIKWHEERLLEELVCFFALSDFNLM